MKKPKASRNSKTTKKVVIRKKAAASAKRLKSGIDKSKEASSHSEILLAPKPPKR